MMKTKGRTTIILVILLLLTMGNLSAQETVPAQEADHEALRTIKDEITLAINNQDIDQLRKYFTEDFVFTTVDQTVLTDLASMKDYYDLMLKADDSLVSSLQMAPEAEIQTVFLDENTGYCYGVSEDTYAVRSSGQSVSMNSRWTALVVKESGQWKIKAVHVGVNFIDNPLIDSLKSLAWRNSLIAVVIGILLGLVTGVIVSRKLGKSKKANG